MQDSYSNLIPPSSTYYLVIGRKNLPCVLHPTFDKVPNFGTIFDREGIQHGRNSMAERIKHVGCREKEASIAKPSYSICNEIKELTKHRIHVYSRRESNW